MRRRESRGSVKGKAGTGEWNMEFRTEQPALEFEWQVAIHLERKASGCL